MKNPLTIQQRLDILNSNKTELTQQITVIDGKITSLQAALAAQEAALAKAAANAQAAANAVNTVGGRRKSMRKNKGKGKTRGRR
jgi:septal ring factor EnvC (AmiA/AmiB activator)